MGHPFSCCKHPSSKTSQRGSDCKREKIQWMVQVLPVRLSAYYKHRLIQIYDLTLVKKKKKKVLLTNNSVTFKQSCFYNTNHPPGFTNTHIHIVYT